MDTERLAIDAQDAARILGVSVGMVYKLLRNQRIGGYAVGRRKKIYADTIDKYRAQSAIVQLLPQPADAHATPRSRPAKTEYRLPARRHLD